MNTRHSALRRALAGSITLSVAIMLWRSSAQALSASATADKANNPPANVTCTKSGCHDTPGGAGNGKVEVIGLPTCYEAGKTYDLKVRITDPDTTRKRWGFEVGAQYSEGNQWDAVGAGTIDNAAGARTKKLTSVDSQRNFITHDKSSTNGDGTYAGTASPAEWAFKWTAPGGTMRQTKVCFYVAGLAADNSGDESGDRTYTNKFCLDPCAATATHEGSWGRLKVHYGR